MTEPIVRLEAELHPYPARRRAPTNRSAWARDEHERCASSCAPAMRCRLVDGHDGLHAWRSLGELRVFEWETPAT